MTETKNARSTANRALTLVLAGGVVAWIFFIAARFTDLSVNVGRTWNDAGEPQPGEGFQPATYLLFVAITALTLCALIGRRIVAGIQIQTSNTLPRAVLRFSSTVLIIGMVLAAIAAVSVFLVNFLDGANGDSALERLVDAYLPIILYTALVITAVLRGFVFSRPAQTPVPAEPVQSDLQIREMQPVESTSQHATHAAASEGTSAPSMPGQRDIAVSYTLPIVAVAAALIFGLIVYDITQTRLEAWIWVVVLVIVAVGITVGTVYAARAMMPQLSVGTAPRGVSVGAKNLNFVLSIIFAVTVSGMAMGYGASAVNQLAVQPALSIDAYSDSGVSGEFGVPAEGMNFNVWGSGLAVGSEATLTVEPAGKVLATQTVDRYGSVWFEQPAAAGLKPGAYELVVQAATIDGHTPSVSMKFTVNSDLRVEFPGEASVNLEEAARIVTPNTAWYVGDLLAAAVLLGLVCGTIYVTLNSRNGRLIRL